MLNVLHKRLFTIPSKFESDVELGQKRTFCKGLDMTGSRDMPAHRCIHEKEEKKAS